MESFLFLESNRSYFASSRRPWAITEYKILMEGFSAVEYNVTQKKRKYGNYTFINL